MANAKKQRIANCKAEVERAEQKQQRAIAAVQEIESRIHALEQDRLETIGRLQGDAMVFMAPEEVAALQARHTALTAMLGKAGFERQIRREHIRQAGVEVQNARRTLIEEQYDDPRQWGHEQFLRA